MDTACSSRRWWPCTWRQEFELRDRSGSVEEVTFSPETQIAISAWEVVPQAGVPYLRCGADGRAVRRRSEKFAG